MRRPYIPCGFVAANRYSVDLNAAKHAGDNSVTGWGRDLLRADGIAEKVGGLDKVATLHGLLGADAP